MTTGGISSLETTVAQHPTPSVSGHRADCTQPHPTPLLGTGPPAMAMTGELQGPWVPWQAVQLLHSLVSDLSPFLMLLGSC